MYAEVTRRRRAHAEIFSGNPIIELVMSALEKMPELHGGVETKVKAIALVKMQFPLLHAINTGR
jgi:hypothetical protein